MNDWQFFNAPFREGESRVVYDTIGAAMEYVEEQPAADVVEVRHGRWIPTLIMGGRGSAGYSCSVCNKFNKTDSNYCPNCGAKMDEVEE